MNIRARKKYEQTKIQQKFVEKMPLFFKIIYMIKLCRNMCKKAKSVWKME